MVTQAPLRCILDREIGMQTYTCIQVLRGRGGVERGEGHISVDAGKGGEREGRKGKRGEGKGGKG